MGKLSDVVYSELGSTQKLSFTGENFLIWKLKLSFILGDHQRCHLLNHPAPEEDDPTANPQNDDAKYLILGTVDGHLFREFERHPTPASIMKSLLTRLNSRFKALNLSMIRRYNAHRMALGTHINQHIFRMPAMAKELEYSGVKIPDEMDASSSIISLAFYFMLCLKYNSANPMLLIQAKSPPQLFTFPDESATLTEVIYPQCKTRLRIDYKESNFPKWKKDLSLVLRSNRVEYVLKDPKPSDQLEKWHGDDFTCRHLILGAMDDGDLFLSFHDYPTAKTLMDDLEECFNSPSTARKLVLLTKYMNHRMSDDIPIVDHTLKMDNMAWKMVTAGIKTPEEMQAVVLMDSLPESWDDTLVRLTVNMSMDEGNGLNLDNVRRRVTDAGQWKEFMAHKDGAMYY
ncbi:hypothetical protein ACH5RR_010238 [Cinchona calisaya]|uniref:Uncharacterized protein n=1 Tax=Cinchona calisaya TaxID=153742 RepID=A0ABD3AGJ5_9GENT